MKHFPAPNCVLLAQAERKQKLDFLLFFCKIPGFSVFRASSLPHFRHLFKFKSYLLSIHHQFTQGLHNHFQFKEPPIPIHSVPVGHK